MSKTKLFLPSSLQRPLSRLNRMLKSKDYADARFFIFVDANSYERCMPYVVSQVEALQEAEFIELPVGEECKSIEIVAQVWQSLVESGADRQSVIVNIGGGSVSDVGGFVAATYMRGIRYINIPTTLLAMVDAAIGGKTAVDVSGIKNVAGTFYQPEAVCVVPQFLQTLPDNEKRSGCMEMLKTMIVGGAFASVPSSIDDILTDENIALCAEIKAEIVAQDPYDRSVRRMLNLGHTFGHAVEAYSIMRQQPLAHGLAVGVGMLCAVYLSERKLGFDRSVGCAMRRLIGEVVDLPVYNLADTQSLLELMHRDKKNAEGSVRCVLLQSIGAVAIDVDVSDEEVRDTLLSYRCM